MHLRPTKGVPTGIVAGAVAALVALGLPGPAEATQGSPATGTRTPAPTTLALADGAKVSYETTGAGTLTLPNGTARPFPVAPVSGTSAFGPVGAPDKAGIERRAQAATEQPYVADELLVGLSGASVTGGFVSDTASRFHVPGARAAETSSGSVNAAFAKVHADAIWKVVPAGSASTTDAAAADIAGMYVLHVTGGDPAAIAKTLAATPGITFAQPNQYVSTIDPSPETLPAATAKAVAAAAAGQRSDSATYIAGGSNPSGASPSGLPDNAGLTTSLQSYLNSSGVDAMGAFADDAHYLHQLPGTGEIVTNVSLGDLTDESMAAAGDSYVSEYGPTTIAQGGQRYLDYPSLPLIPTYTADQNGTLDPLGTTENQDPNLGEVLLDFSMMAPLPHNLQRASNPGSGPTDLLGIAPGAKYRLVVPQQETEQDLAEAFLAAANQNPRPNVITASVGWSADGIGYAGRYLEDDPLMHAVIDEVVSMGIAVVISSNDGTREGLPVAIGPDGGSVPIDTVAPTATTTNFTDDQMTTQPTRIADSGAIVAGASTLDDTLAASGSTAEYPTTRYDGGTDYSSGFGTRVDLAAPGDNLPALIHVCDRSTDPGCTGTDAEVTLDGGTSASAPMIAAAMADVLQAAKATGRTLTPVQLRDLLVDTGRPLAQTPQTDQTLQMGPELDVTKAVESVLGEKFHLSLGAVRLSVAQRQELGQLGAEFEEGTDPADIDLTGQNVVSPITFGLDMTGASHGGLSYRLLVGAHGVIPASGPAVRVTPAQFFAAAGLPLIAAASRTVPITFEALRGTRLVASAKQSLTFSATDGTYPEALAPTAPGSAPLGEPVTVHYDLTGVQDLNQPVLEVSSVGHWTPNGGGDIFRAQYSVALTKPSGDVTIPAAVFAPGGAGLYGIGIRQQVVPQYGGAESFYGEFRAIRIGDPTGDGRPVAPSLGSGSQAGSMALEVSRADPTLPVTWNVRSVPGATGAILEFSAPGPTLYGSLNTFTNANGSGPDDNGGDNGSTALVTLPRTAGSTALNLNALKIPDSLQYSVRVLATRNGKPIGQASPTAFVQYDDGQQVQPGEIQNFTASVDHADGSDDTATISLADFGPGAAGPYSLTNTALRQIDLQTGAIGAPYAVSTDGSQMDDVVGMDPNLHLTVMMTVPYAGGEPGFEVYASNNGTDVADVPLPIATGASVDFLAAKLDPVRHRAVAITYDETQGISQMWELNLLNMTVSPPITLNDGTLPDRAFDTIAIDESTGTVFASPAGTQGPCLMGYAQYGIVSVNLDAGTASPVAHQPVCTAGLLADGKGDDLYVVTGAAQPNPEGGNFPASTWSTLNQQTLATTQGPTGLGAQGPAWPVLDEVHGVALVAQLYENDYLTDNNAMSEIDTIDPAAGEVLNRAHDVNLLSSSEETTNFQFTADTGLVIDPQTRTGWVVGAYADELERFEY